FVALAPGESRTLRNERFLDDGRASIEVTVSASPTLRIRDALRYVVGYPYGCLEQTVSRLMPMYLLRKNQDLVESVIPEEANLNGYIEAGINRVIAMQTPSGGLGFWPGANDPYPYGSIYGLHFLTVVKEGREFTVPDEPFR